MYYESNNNYTKVTYISDFEEKRHSKYIMSSLFDVVQQLFKEKLLAYFVEVSHRYQGLVVGEFYLLFANLLHIDILTNL